MTFTLNAAQLNSRYFSSQAKLVTRHGVGMGLDEDNWFTLFRETIAGEDGSWWVVLEGTPEDGVEAGLQLVVMVWPTIEPENVEACWQATLTWGDYVATVVIDKNGRASFPLFNGQSVLDDDALTIMANLKLQLDWQRT